MWNHTQLRITLAILVSSLIALTVLPPITGAGRQYVSGVQSAAGAMEPSRPLLFLTAVTYQLGPHEGNGANSAVIADVNGDGKPDLLVANGVSNEANTDGTVDVRLGNGDGTFQAAISYDSGGFGPGALAVGDLNGDGILDVVVANCAPPFCSNADGVLGILLGKGDGSFQPAITYDSGGILPHSVSVADVNGDGIPDVVVANCTSSTNPCNEGFRGLVGVLLGNGNGSFRSVVNYDSGGDEAESVAVADVNGDGRPDLVVANTCDSLACPGSSIGVLFGNGDGTFKKAVEYEWSTPIADSVVIADVNGDGRPDLIVASIFCSGSGCSGSVGVLLGNSNGTFQAPVTYGSGGTYASSLAVRDVNGDGKPDVLVANQCLLPKSNCKNGVVGVLLGNGDGTFQPAESYFSRGSQAYSVAAADVNGDGWPDLLVANGIVSVLLNNGAPNATTTVVKTSKSPSLVGQQVTFTARVTSPFATIPNFETVTFFDRGTRMGTAATANGTAKFSTRTLRPGTRNIDATYNGDATFKRSSGTLTQVVELASTMTVLTSSLNPSTHGQAVTFTAKVTSAGPSVPTGKVVFADGTTGIGTTALSGGVATLTTSTLVVGRHPITAEYLGDAKSAKSMSAALEQVVN